MGTLAGNGSSINKSFIDYVHSFRFYEFMIRDSLHIWLLVLSEFKIGLSPSKKNCFIFFKKWSKILHFHLKRYFRSRDISTFVLTFWSCRKKDLTNLKIYEAWLTSNYSTHITQYPIKQRQTDNETWSVDRIWQEKHFSSKIMQKMKQEG